jgi:hypothetical protein
MYFCEKRSLSVLVLVRHVAIHADGDLALAVDDLDVRYRVHRETVPNASDPRQLIVGTWPGSAV